MLRAHGLDLVIYGEGAWDAEKEARQQSQKQRTRFHASPYNDPIVVGGRERVGMKYPSSFPIWMRPYLPAGRGDC